MKFQETCKLLENSVVIKQNVKSWTGFPPRFCYWATVVIHIVYLSNNLLSKLIFC